MNTASKKQNKIAIVAENFKRDGQSNSFLSKSVVSATNIAKQEMQSIALIFELEIYHDFSNCFYNCLISPWCKILARENF